jgi:hypothetical protein
VRLLQVVGATPAGRADELDPLASASATRLGMPSLTLEFLRKNAVRLRWRMNRLLVLVGTAPACKVRVRHWGVSRFHCSLVSTAQGVWVVDLLSRAGVRLNGVRTRCARVEDGDLLQLSGLSVRVRYDEPDLPESYPPSYLGDGVARLDALERTAGGPDTRGAVRLLAPAAAAGLPAPCPAAGQGQALALPAVAPEQGLAALLLPLLNQLHQSQQQMFDQFQQATLRMFDLFSGLHQDQMAYLREELDRQRELTRELQGLQAELSKLRPGALPESARLTGATPRPEGSPLSEVPAAPAAKRQPPSAETPESRTPLEKAPPERSVAPRGVGTRCMPGSASAWARWSVNARRAGSGFSAS